MASKAASPPAPRHQPTDLYEEVVAGKSRPVFLSTGQIHIILHSKGSQERWIPSRHPCTGIILQSIRKSHVDLQLQLPHQPVCLQVTDQTGCLLTLGHYMNLPCPHWWEVGQGQQDIEPIHWYRRPCRCTKCPISLAWEIRCRSEDQEPTALPGVPPQIKIIYFSIVEIHHCSFLCPCGEKLVPVAPPQRCGAPRSATGHQGALTRLRCSAGQGCSSTEAGIEPGQWLPGAHLCHCSAGPAALGTRIATASVQQARHRTLFEFVFIYLFLWVLVPFFFVVYFLFLNSFSTLIRNITWFWLELLT